MYASLVKILSIALYIVILFPTAALEKVCIFSGIRICINVDRRIAKDLPCKIWQNTEWNSSVMDCSSRGLTNIEGSFLNTSALNISTIQLQNNNLTSLYPDSFVPLNRTNLLDIYLRQNSIRDIHPMAFIQMYNLEKLDLTNNNIEHLAPNVFKDLLSLKWLSLFYNALTTIPYEALLPLSLTYLDLGVNPVPSFTPENELIPRNAQVQDLRLWPHERAPDLHLDDSSFQYFNATTLRNLNLLYYDRVNVTGPLAFAPLRELKTLIICVQDIHDLLSVSENIKELIIVCSIYFKPNITLTASYLKKFAKFNPSLKEFQMTFYITSIEDDAFQWISSIKHLYLLQNGLEHISSGAFNHLPYLEELDLSENFLTVVPSDALQVFRNSNLQILSFYTCTIQSIPETFSNPFGSDNLQVLDLTGNTIKGNLLEEKPTFQKQSLQAKTLDLSFCKMEANDFIVISKKFDLSSISRLNLNGNEFKSIPSGTATVLKTLSNLKELLMSNSLTSYYGNRTILFTILSTFYLYKF